MIVSMLFFGFFAVAFGQGNYSDVNMFLETLKVKAEDGSRKVQETIENVNNSTNSYDDFIEERSKDLIWEFIVQKKTLNKTIENAVFKGMSKNKPFQNFQCISKGAKDAFNKLDDIKSQMLVDSENMRLKRLEEVMPFSLVLSALYDYLQDLYKTKKEEIKKATNENEMNKIFNEFLKMMSRLNTILDQINDHVRDTKFKFFTDYINYAYATEKKVRNIQKDGSQNILKCVA